MKTDESDLLDYLSTSITGKSTCYKLADMPEPNLNAVETKRPNEQEKDSM